jgi:hypothetical protein
VIDRLPIDTFAQKVGVPQRFPAAAHGPGPFIRRLGLIVTERIGNQSSETACLPRTIEDQDRTRGRPMQLQYAAES